MRKSVFCCILTMVLVASLASCRGWFEPAPDRELFGDYEPLEWKDSYIFAATNYYPPQVQVWDTADGEVKFVRSYNLWVDKRDLTIWDLAVLDRVVWVAASGMQRNLLRLDVQSGELRFLDLDIGPEFVHAIPEGEDGKGCIVTSTYCDSRIGVAVRFLDTEGNTIRKCNVEYRGLNAVSPAAVVYEGGRYYTTAATDTMFDVGTNPSGYKVIDYSESAGRYVTELPSAGPLEGVQEVLNHAKLLELPYMVNFIVHPPSYPEDPCYATTGMFADGRRFLFRCESLATPKFVYTGISHTTARSIHSATQGGEKIFLTGRTLDINYSDLNGLETGVYPASGGSQLKRIEMPDGNQLHCTELPECTWFSCNVWGTDKYGDFVDKGTIPRIYRLDYATESVTCYWADGRVEKMRELPG